MLDTGPLTLVSQQVGLYIADFGCTYAPRVSAGAYLPFRTSKESPTSSVSLHVSVDISGPESMQASDV